MALNAVILAINSSVINSAVIRIRTLDKYNLNLFVVF